MRDRSSDPSEDELKKEIGKILSEALAENLKAKPTPPPSGRLPAPPYVLWRGAGLFLAIVSAWPIEMPQPLQPLLFVAACSCTLVAIIQYMRLPGSKAKSRFPKLAALHRIR